MFHYTLCAFHFKYLIIVLYALVSTWGDVPGQTGSEPLQCLPTNAALSTPYCTTLLHEGRTRISSNHNVCICTFGLRSICAHGFHGCFVAQRIHLCTVVVYKFVPVFHKPGSKQWKCYWDIHYLCARLKVDAFFIFPFFRQVIGSYDTVF